MNNIHCESYQNKRLNEEYRRYRHPSGLDIYIFPKKMTTSYAILGTRYGSIHNSFTYEGDDEWTTVPDGIAHFLEHKLFVCEDGSDAFERFSDYGADANAYTSFNKTCYLFSCTERFSDSLGELLDFVTHPYFTKESVANEIGIIAEEIKMYDDNPADKCFYGMLEGLYSRRKIERGTIIHSDQGTLYQSFIYQKNLADRGIIQSMSRKATCLDNAVIENFFGILKSEMFYGQNFESIEHFTKTLEEYLIYYNEERIKIKLDGLSPIQYRLTKFAS